MNTYTQDVSIEKPFVVVRSRVAVLGTLAELHRKPIKYDLRALRRLVRELKPDLLCAEIHPDDWKKDDLNAMLPEYRDALLPLSRRTNIIVVPVSSWHQPDLFAPSEGRLLGLRRWLVRLLTGQLRLMQRLANGPRAINSGLFGWVCDGVCSLTAWVCGPEVQRTWDQANQAMVNNILAAIHRDPGRRVLITVDCRRRHRLERYLRSRPEVELVHYRAL